jgi:positive regulator of sigma E activity
MTTDKEFEEHERRVLLSIQEKQTTFNSILAYATCIIALVGIFQILNTYWQGNVVLMILFVILVSIPAFFVIKSITGNPDSHAWK